MSSSSEAVKFINIAATPAAFTILGGRYSVIVHAGVWGVSGSVTLKMLAADGVTWVQCINVGNQTASFTVDAVQQFDLPPGQLQLAVATATGVYATIARINY